MSFRIQFGALPEDYDWIPQELGARFGRSNEEQGICIRQVNIINDLTRPCGINIWRLDKRYYREEMKKKIREWENNPNNKVVNDMMNHFFTLPRAAIQGLCISSRQDMSVLDDAPVDDRLGPHARTQDGGKVRTQGDKLGKFPKVEAVGPNSPDLVSQPFRRLHTNAAEDGTTTNEVITLFHGRASFFFQARVQATLQRLLPGLLGTAGREPGQPDPGRLCQDRLQCRRRHGLANQLPGAGAAWAPTLPWHEVQLAGHWAREVDFHSTRGAGPLV
mmetsp:Transcript_82938/g.168326  ORF Transcript_82938/g.168326 Transcript_82938/m.168326 type:complete len:275 (-) Transcript_82938:92-916(-)